jgi:hypothetical protein
MSGQEFARLESERLILRRFADSDLAPFLAYRNDPEVARYQAWESCTEHEASAMIEEMKSLQPGAPGEWFQFAIELKQTGALIGDCALKVEQDGRQAEIGFTLSRERFIERLIRAVTALRINHQKLDTTDSARKGFCHLTCKEKARDRSRTHRRSLQDDHERRGGSRSCPRHGRLRRGNG